MTDKYNIHVIITNPYTEQIYNYDVNISEYTLNEVIDEITSNNVFVINENTGISIYDNDLKFFIFCGNYPLNTLVTIEKIDTVIIINIVENITKTYFEEV